MNESQQYISEKEIIQYFIDELKDIYFELCIIEKQIEELYF